MQAMDIAKLLAAMLGILGPAPANQSKELGLKSGDQIVAIGDSITRAGGYLHDMDAVLAAQYPELKLPKIINVGVSGNRSGDLIKRFEKDVLAKKPQVVTISIGVNDVWHRLDKPHDPQVLTDFTADVTSLVDQAQKAGIRVVLVTPTIIMEDPQAEGNQRMKMYLDAYQKIATEKHCAIANLHQLFLDALAKKPAEVQGNWLTSDGVHMKPAGDAIMAIGVLRAFGVPDSKIALPEKAPEPAAK